MEGLGDAVDRETKKPYLWIVDGVESATYSVKKNRTCRSVHSYVDVLLNPLFLRNTRKRMTGNANKC